MEDKASLAVAVDDPLAEVKKKTHLLAKKEEFRVAAHKRRLELIQYLGGPGLTLSVIAVVTLVIAGSLGVLVLASDPESKKVAGQILIPSVTALLGLLGGGKMMGAGKGPGAT